MTVLRVVAALALLCCFGCCGVWGAMEWYLRHDPQGWYFRELDRRAGEDQS